MDIDSYLLELGNIAHRSPRKNNTLLNTSNISSGTETNLNSPNKDKSKPNNYHSINNNKYQTNDSDCDQHPPKEKKQRRETMNDDEHDSQLKNTNRTTNGHDNTRETGMTSNSKHPNSLNFNAEDQTANDHQSDEDFNFNSQVSFYLFN
jgi:hypothetical protein